MKDAIDVLAPKKSSAKRQPRERTPDRDPSDPDDDEDDDDDRRRRSDRNKKHNSDDNSRHRSTRRDARDDI